METDLHQFASVTELGWQPTNPARPNQLKTNGKLKGQYILKVKRRNGDITEVIPTSDWAENIFKPQVLAAAQEAF